MRKLVSHTHTHTHTHTHYSTLSATMARVMTGTVAAINVTMTTHRCTVSVILYMSVCVTVHFLRLLVSYLAKNVYSKKNPFLLILIMAKGCKFVM